MLRSDACAVMQHCTLVIRGSHALGLLHEHDSRPPESGRRRRNRNRVVTHDACEVATQTPKSNVEVHESPPDEIKLL